MSKTHVTDIYRNYNLYLLPRDSLAAQRYENAFTHSQKKIQQWVEYITPFQAFCKQ